MSDNRDRPYLSVVTSSRNDDHGRNMSKRMQVALSSLITQLERYELDSEIILVDYNPPTDKPLLKDDILWPNQTKYCTVRTIVVPASIHNRYKDSDKVPFCGGRAQNVGIRRARGKFVLSTPIDILFANELIKFIAEKNLDENKIYRTDRLDVSREAADIPSLDDRLAFCRENVTWIHTRYGSIPVVRKGKKHLTSKNLQCFDRPPNKKDIWKLHFNGGDLTLMSKEVWCRVRGWPEDDVLSLGAEVVLYGMVYLHGVREEMLQSPCSVYHIEHDSRWRQKITVHPFVKLCFYCLPDRLAISITSVLSPVYRTIASILLRRKTKLDSLDVDHRTLAELRTIVNRMLEGKRPNVFNDINWGLGDEHLEEYVIAKADWDVEAPKSPRLQLQGKDAT